MKTELQGAIEVLVEALENDEDYHHSWVSNIAMAFYDTVKNQAGDDPYVYLGDLADMSNAAAKNFLRNLCARQK